MQRFSDKELIDILSLSPNATAVYTGENIVIQTANDAMIAFWGKDRTVIGMPLEKALPELEGQPFIGILQNVWRTGTNYEAKDTLAELKVDGRLQTFYFDFLYRALKNEQGEVYCILHTATDVTERNTTRRALQDAQRLQDAFQKEKALNQQLVQSQQQLYALNTELEERVIARTKDLTISKQALQELNEELSAANEEQTAINEDLQHAEKALIKASRHLQASEARLEHILAQVSIPVLVLSGPRQIVAIANDAMLRFWGKQQEDVMGRPMLYIFPELKGQAFPKIWKQVYETGETVIGKEKPVMYNMAEGLRVNYVDYHYQPLRDLDGHITGILATIIDTTDKVAARRLVEENEERMRLTIESANLGTWFIDAITRKFIPSPRLKEMFGYHPEEEMPYDAAITQITDEYRDTVAKAVENAITKGEAYDLEYPIVGYHDSKLRWVKATGKLFTTSDGQPGNFSGTIADITERKQDDQRKNDFINMVSHELKTPLTSISGYVQLLKTEAQKTANTFAATLVDKTYNQVKKMTTMINGFLNMSRLESGKIHLDITSFNIEDLLKEVIEESSLLFPQHKIRVSACSDIFLKADKDKIGQVIINFISNAVKYAYASKVIDITCRHGGAEAIISVTDYGKGIKPQDREKIFERYHRVTTQEQSTVAGFGIGLYLCAEIINRHHGQIGVSSEEGKGSTFWFSLPME